MSGTTGGQAASRALLNIRLTPASDGFQLRPTGMFTGYGGYRPNYLLNVPGLNFNQPTAAPPAAPSGGGTPAEAPGGNTEWVTLSQAVVQFNPANALLWANRPGSAAPAPAATLQFNLLFGGFGNRFQIGQYISGSGTFGTDSIGRSYSLSWGLLAGGNDLLVRGPVSFINPQLQVGPNFSNLGRPDVATQIGGNISNFINFSQEGSALTVGIGGQIGYAYDLSSGVSAVSASLLLQLQLQRMMGRP